MKRQSTQERQVDVGEALRKCLPDQVRDDLAIGERTIDGGPHGPELGLAERRLNGGARQFAIGQVNPVAGCFDDYLLQKLGADLVAEATRAAMNADDDVPQMHAKGGSRVSVKYLPHLLDFYVACRKGDGRAIAAVEADCPIDGAVYP